MKKSLSIFFCFVLSGSAVFAWSYNSHVGMTGAAAAYVFNLDKSATAPIVKPFSVNIKYDMHVDFGKTAGMGFNISGTGGVLESFVGSIIDMTVIDEKFKVDTTMNYPPPKKPQLNTLYKIMREAGSDPDTYDAKTGLIGRGQMLIGHIYGPNGIGFADFMVEFCYNQAVNAWKQNQKNQAYVFLAYASHYLEDCGIPLHAEADYRNLRSLQMALKYHTFTEDYVSENWQVRGYQAIADSAARVPMPVCDISAMARSLAMETYPDLAEWNRAWGEKGGGDYQKGDEPVNQKVFDELIRQEIWRCVPRVSGLFMKFKQEVMK
jgi:hypothetical protein